MYTIIHNNDIEIKKIKKILKSFFKKDEHYVLKNTKKIRNGKFITIKHNDIQNDDNNYIIFSSDIPNGRNTYLVQGFYTALKKIIDIEKPKTKEELKKIFNHISVYLFDEENKEVYNNYQKLIYRTLYTIGIKFFNIKYSLYGENKINKFGDMTDWIVQREKNQSKNSSNQSSYLIDEKNKYIFLGKSNGANGCESILFSIALSFITNKPIDLIPMKKKTENDNSKMFKNFKNILKILNISLKNEFFNIEKEEKIKKTSRNQSKFKVNLINKFKEKKCYICGNKIPDLIIASHIYRITDIDNSLINFSEKEKYSVNANNGFWLCANHDKMFENGIIGFDKNGYLIINKEYYSKYKLDILNNLKTTKIKSQHLNSETIFYLTKHRERLFKNQKNFFKYNNKK